MSNHASITVFIIEMPSADDLYENRLEGGLLRQSLALAEMKSEIRVSTNDDTFKHAIADALACLDSQQGSIPILHISAHGHSGGLALLDGPDLDWDRLGHILSAVNYALGGELILCMSSCSGYSINKHALLKTVSDEFSEPYNVMVGNVSEPTWAETAVGFATFYHLLQLGRTVDEAVDAMRIASGNSNFKTIDGDGIQRLRDTLQKADLTRVAEAMRRIQGGN